MPRKKHTHPINTALVPCTSAFIPDLAFTTRWTAGLQKAYDEGGWLVMSAGAQQGKTWPNRAFLQAHPAVKRTDGTFEVPVAATVACPQQALLLRDLAASLGVSALLRRGNAIEVIASVLIRAQTKLLLDTH